MPVLIFQVVIMKLEKDEKLDHGFRTFNPWDSGSNPDWS